MKSIHPTWAARQRRRTMRVQCCAVALLLLLALPAGISMGAGRAGAEQAGAGRTAAVQVRQSPVRGKASFLGPVLYTLDYGQSVHVLEDRGAWLRVEAQGREPGWTHVSALTQGGTALRAGAASGGASGGTSGGASGNELALAGKGFNARVEASYREQNSGADYAQVTAMEQTRNTEPAMRRFLMDGLVFPPPQEGRP